MIRVEGLRILLVFELSEYSEPDSYQSDWCPSFRERLLTTILEAIATLLMVRVLPFL